MLVEQHSSLALFTAGVAFVAILILHSSLYYNNLLLLTEVVVTQLVNF